MSTALSPTGVEVRDAGGSDLPAVRRVLLAAYQEYAMALPPAVFGRYLAEILDVEERLGNGRLLVAEHGGRVVGTVTWYDDAATEGLGWPAGWAGLRALGVEPSARGLGIGRALVEACRRRALAAGAPALTLHTGGFMTAAVALYEAMGFRRDPAYDFDATRRLGSAGSGPSRSSPTASTSPGTMPRSASWAARQPSSASCTRTRSPGSAGSCGSRPPGPTATCWWSTCT